MVSLSQSFVVCPGYQKSSYSPVSGYHANKYKSWQVSFESLLACGSLGVLNIVKCISCAMWPIVGGAKVAKIHKTTNSCFNKTGVRTNDFYVSRSFIKYFFLFIISDRDGVHTHGVVQVYRLHHHLYGYLFFFQFSWVLRAGLHHCFNCLCVGHLQVGLKNPT